VPSLARDNENTSVIELFANADRQMFPPLPIKAAKHGSSERSN
jgi:hypothetical protein